MSFLLLYGFSGEKLAAQTPPLRTKIDADYLIKYQLPSGITFFFFGQAEGRLLRALTFYQQRTGLQPRTDKIHLA